MLKKIIGEYIPFNEQEAKDKAVIMSAMDVFDNLLTRDNEWMHFTSSGFVVNKTRDKVLMVYHNIYNSWSWTGGHVDGVDDMLHVAMREVMEETGVKAIRPVDTGLFMLDTLPVLGHFKKGMYVSAHIHLSVAYLLEADEQEVLRINPDENSNVAWIPIDEVVSKSTEPQMQAVYEKAIQKLRRMEQG